MKNLTKDQKKATNSDAGRLGAFALNSDPDKKRAACIKAAQTRKAKNPNCFDYLSQSRKKQK